MKMLNELNVKTKFMLITKNKQYLYVILNIFIQNRTGVYLRIKIYSF